MLNGNEWICWRTLRCKGNLQQSNSVQWPCMSFLFLKYKNFHFSDGKVLISCEKCRIILTGWTLVRVIQACRAVAGIWCIGNTKIRTTSKYWPIATVAIDSIAFSPSNQRHLCWWQTAWVDKAEQEWAWCSFVISRTWWITETLSLIMTLEPNSQNYHKNWQLNI